jgi:hypothetical protein
MLHNPIVLCAEALGFAVVAALIYVDLHPPRPALNPFFVPEGYNAV